MLMSCIEHQVHSSSFAGPSRLTLLLLAQCGVEHAYTRCVALPTMSFILPSCQPLLLPAHGHAVLPTGLSSSLNGLSATLKPLFGIGHRPAHTHPHATRAPLPLVSFVCLPGCAFPLFILLSFIYM